MTDHEVETAKEWFALSQFLGWVYLLEANGYPFANPSPLSNLVSSLKMEKSSLRCGQNFARAFDEVSKPLSSYFSNERWNYQFPTIDARMDLRQRTRAMINLIEECLATLPADHNTIALSFEETMLLHRTGIKVHAFGGAPPPLTFAEYIEVNRKVAERMRRLETIFDMEKLRTRTIEDQVDELAISVLKGMGYNAQPYLDLFAEAIQSRTKQGCEGFLEIEIEPPFGSIYDVHHSFAWRSYSLTHFAKRAGKVDGLE